MGPYRGICVGHLWWYTLGWGSGCFSRQKPKCVSEKLFWNLLCPRDMTVEKVTLWSFLLSSLNRESSTLTSASLVGALDSFRAQCAMGARCLCFGTALRTHSKPSSVLLAMRMGYSAAGAVQAKNGISTCANSFYCTAAVCNMIFFFFKRICLSNSVNKNQFIVYFCWFDYWSHLNITISWILKCMFLQSL